MSVRAMEAGREVKRVAGREFRARTGMRQRDTHVAWAKKAMKKEGGRCGFCRSGSRSRRRRCGGRGMFLLFCLSIVF